MAEPILQFFAHAHLPGRLREVSALFGELAVWIEAELPRNAERSAALERAGASDPVASAEGDRRALMAALEAIEGLLPACSPGAEEVWANRQWAGRFRDLQRIARAALQEARGR